MTDPMAAIAHGPRLRDSVAMSRSLFSPPADANDKLHGNKPKKTTQVEKTVRHLIRFAMDADEGAYLGSEAELLEKLDVSRPTLRQATKIVASDQLIEIRRGASGGFYARRPDARHIVQGPAFYLRLSGATLEQALVANSVIAMTIAEGAAKSTDQDLRDQAKSLLDELDGYDTGEFDVRTLLDLELRLVGLAASMANNPVLQLYQQIGYEFGQLERNLSFFIDHPERRDAYRLLQQQYCRALLDSDAELAKLISSRRSRAVREWLVEDMSPDGDSDD